MTMFIISKNKYLSNDMKIFGTCSIPLNNTIEHIWSIKKNVWGNPDLSNPWRAGVHIWPKKIEKHPPPVVFSEQSLIWLFHFLNLTCLWDRVPINVINIDNNLDYYVFSSLKIYGVLWSCQQLWLGCGCGLKWGCNIWENKIDEGSQGSRFGIFYLKNWVNIIKWPHNGGGRHEHFHMFDRGLQQLSMHSRGGGL